jgi:hypothetical protein
VTRLSAIIAAVVAAALTAGAVAVAQNDPPDSTPMPDGRYDCDFEADGFTCVPEVPPSTTTTPPTTSLPTTSTTLSPTTTTTAVTSTTAPAATTTTAPAATTTTPPPDGVLFSEAFDGSQGLERFRTGVFHRERDAFEPSRPDWINTTPWQAAHDTRLTDCGDPNVHSHPVSAANDADMIYVCREHLMTTMSDVSGYSVVWFSPDQVFNDVREVCWDATVSRDVMGDRQWWEVMVLPADGPDVTAINWLAGTANLPTYGEAGAVVLGYGPDNPVHPKISVGDAEPARGPWPGHPAWGAAYSNQATRIPHCFREVDGQLEYETRQADGSMWSFRTTGTFPDGPLKVVFKDHNYTPNKACGDYWESCETYTWHWDRIKVSA